MATPSPSSPKRAAHPTEPTLVGGLDLSSKALGGRADATEIAGFAKMMANAEYWLSFDLAKFETLLLQCPTPLRELGVAVLLRFGEDLGGTLTAPDVDRALETLQPDLPEDLWVGIQPALVSLRRAVAARDAADGLCKEGFARTHKDAGVNAHALRAMGSAKIFIEGVDDRDKAPELDVGASVSIHATDERGRATAKPEVESRLGAEVLIRDDGEARQVVFLVPGRYQVWVPNKATGTRTVFAR